MLHWQKHQMNAQSMKDVARQLSETMSNVMASDGTLSPEDAAKSHAIAYLMAGAHYIEALEQSGDPYMIRLEAVETHDLEENGKPAPRLELYGLDIVGKLWVYIMPDDVDDGRKPGWQPLPSGRGVPPTPAPSH